MMVTWVTMHTSHEPVVEFGINGLDASVLARTTRFVDGGLEKRHMYIHRAVLKGLQHSQKYRKF